MKVNELLDKVTLKLPNGGKLPLKKYVPYITNADETIEDLGSSSNNGLLYFEDKEIIIPDAFMTTIYFDSEDAMWEYRYRVEVLNETSIMENDPSIQAQYYHEGFPKIFTKEEFTEYYNSLIKVFGEIGSNNINDQEESSEYFLTDFFNNMVSPLYKNELKENQIILSHIAGCGGTYIEPVYKLSSYFEEVDYNDDYLDGAPQEAINWFNENIINSGYHIYKWKENINNEALPEIPQEYMDRFRDLTLPLN